ncbi:hypothetical protein V2P20_09035 [Methylobacter sp. Wu1]|uniref:hypothetical protein n=1 Tax=Methylobacter sp. Wu1 TaxID=3119359 RepID=UPI002F933AA7
MTCRLVAIDPDTQLREVWGDVREGLNDILNKGNYTWLPEDVYFAIKNRSSVLLVGIADNRFSGFIIISINKGFDGLEGNIWCAYNIGKSEYINKLWPEITGFCRAAGCKRVTMSSNRPGWAKLGAKLGLEPVQTLYSTEI